MIKIILVAAFIGVAAAQHGQRTSAPRSSGNSQNVEIVKSEVENNGDGTYSYRYETSDGTIVEEKGSLKPPPAGSDEPIQVAEGSYQYISPEGETISTKYIANEGGFQPQGAHLPTPPPIPPEIQKALELIYKNAGEQVQQGNRPRPSQNGNVSGRQNLGSRV